MLGSLLVAPSPARAQADAALLSQGWVHTPYDGIRPARFRPSGDGIFVAGEGAGSFIYRRVDGVPGCLSWRWRVDLGPPPTDLTRRGGDDRAVSVAVGFAGWSPRATVWQRTQHAVAQARAGDKALPRSVLIYAWGGTGQEPLHFYSPWMPGLGRVRILRPASAPRGRWFEEQVDLRADWRDAFGGEAPALMELAIGTDADDTRSHVEAVIERFRFTACP